VTNDPYLLARRPYLNEFDYEDILGWVSPASITELANHPDPAVADLFVLND
jgi:hypothetical protein